MKVEIYFDFLCEYCEMGHQQWQELFPKFPQIQPIWCPCEAHPLELEPYYGRHSHFAIEGLFFIQENRGELSNYVNQIFSAVWEKGENIEDIGLLSHYAESCGVDKTEFQTALKLGKYRKKRQQANLYAWQQLHFQAVPSYFSENGICLRSPLGVGISKKQLDEFFEKICLK